MKKNLWTPRKKRVCKMGKRKFEPCHENHFCLSPYQQPKRRFFKNENHFTYVSILMAIGCTVPAILLVTDAWTKEVTYWWSCEVEVGASPKHYKVKIIFLFTLTNKGAVFPFCMRCVGDDAIKSPYRGIFRLEYDFCSVVAVTSKTITNIYLLMININFCIIQKYFNTS